MSIKLKASIALALCALLFCSCGTKEELFDSYDSCFVPIPIDSGEFVLTPETQSRMIYSEVYEYSFTYQQGMRISFSCPVEVEDARYEWYITRLEDPSTILRDEDGEVYHWYTQNISFFIKNSDDCVFYKDVSQSNLSCSYRIHLWVIVGEQRFYDSAVLAFHTFD